MATSARDKTPGQLFALAFGAVYLLVGILGFAVTGFDNFFNSNADEILILFPVNPAHNVVHLLLGAIWLAGSRTAAGAKVVNMGIGVAYLAVFLLGLVGALQWLSIESGINPDQLLHLVTGAASVYFGTAGATARRPVTA
jgi:F0F1-type ATP synthase membrane subunit a